MSGLFRQRTSLPGGRLRFRFRVMVAAESLASVRGQCLLGRLRRLGARSARATES